jgi:hypothetical protein
MTGITVAPLGIPCQAKKYWEYDVMRNIFTYNVDMPDQFEKKDIPLPLKVPSSLKLVLERIAVHEDRPVGYVARELMVRGLGQYQKDGRLRDDQPERKMSLGKRTTITRKEDVK